MKVLLVNTSSYYVKQKAALPLGLLSIATFLKQKGHEPIVFDTTVQGGSIKKYIKKYKPDIVGLSLPGSMSINNALKLSKIVKDYKIPVVWGGPTASLIPELSLDSGVVDYVIIGDG
ncbi:MAG TPA: cobalamin B12-binding domain-containing protein, partial [Oscillospiraceae bacterium]|nr:cobalamin B12-binding domain-containing protein [Oscillospiraceae bacterium]